jgi:hypothetical protein
MVGYGNLQGSDIHAMHLQLSKSSRLFRAKLSFREPETGAFFLVF